MSTKERIRQFFAENNLPFLLLCGFVFLASGFLSAFFTGGSELYSDILLPSFAPPAFVFPLVWSILYLLIGASFGIVFLDKRKGLSTEKRKGLILLILQHLFNLIWYPLFFGAQNFFVSLVDILIMIFLTVLVIYFFSAISKTATVFLFIYLLWLVFAALLNAGALVLNGIG